MILQSAALCCRLVDNLYSADKFIQANFKAQLYNSPGSSDCGRSTPLRARMTTGYIILAEATTDTPTRGVTALADDDIVVCDATEARRRCDMLTGKVGSMPPED